jgi:hypothetical protein
MNLWSRMAKCTKGASVRPLFTAARALVAVGLSAQPALAEQVVVADVAYTHSAQTTKDSHYRVQPTPATPANWQSPVSYEKGSVHVRLEVKTKPSATPTRFQICFEMKQNYCCTDQAPAYTKTGVYEWDTDVEKLWRPGPVDFSKGIVDSALILKDTNNVKPAPENVGEATSALYMPSDVAVTVTLVSTGAVFQPPKDPEMPVGGSGGGAAGGMATGGSGGASASAGTGGSAAGADTGGSAGAPVIPPQPSGGTGTMPITTPAGGAALPGTAGNGNGLAATPNDDAGCNIGRNTGNGASRAALLVALSALAGLLSRRRSA